MEFWVRKVVVRERVEFVKKILSPKVVVCESSNDHPHLLQLCVAIGECKGKGKAKGWCKARAKAMARPRAGARLQQRQLLRFTLRIP